MKQGVPGMQPSNLSTIHQVALSLSMFFLDVPTWQDFLSKNLPPNSRIGIDPTLISFTDAQNIAASLISKGSHLVPLSSNLVDEVWKSDGRPARPQNKVGALSIQFAGQKSEEKVEALRGEMKKQEADAVVVTMLDEVAWLFNLRGTDIDFNPGESTPCLQ